MAAHSPAPWRLNQITNQAYVVSSARGEVVVEFRYTGDQVPTALNAWLTVAAPDLLAALKRLRSVAVWDDDYAEKGEVLAAAELADAAIAKAEGSHEPSGAAAPTTDLVAELSAAIGYMRNAKIDLETGATKATAIRTIEGGIKRAEAALAQAETR